MLVCCICDVDRGFIAGCLKVFQDCILKIGVRENDDRFS